MLNAVEPCLLLNLKITVLDRKEGLYLNLFLCNAVQSLRACIN